MDMILPQTSAEASGMILKGDVLTEIDGVTMRGCVAFHGRDSL